MEENLKKTKINIKIIALIVSSLALLLIAISISLYYLYILPKQQSEKFEFEKQKYEDELHIKEDAEKKKQEEVAQKQNNLDMCLVDAQSIYVSNWRKYCPLWKSEVDKDWKDCRANANMWSTDEQNKQFCITSTPDYKEDTNGSCVLPNKYSEGVEQHFKEMKEECYRKYPIN